MLLQTCTLMKDISPVKQRCTLSILFVETLLSCINQYQSVFFKVLLCRKLHLSNLSDFKTYTCSLHKDKNAVYCFQISLFVPEIFKCLKYAHIFVC